MEELQARLSAVQPYLSSITSIAGFFNFSGPWLARIVSTCRGNLIEHPDLASVTMLLVIFYISFLMLVRAWRFTIGSFKFAFKSFLLIYAIVLVTSLWSAIVKNDSANLDALVEVTKSGFHVIWLLFQRAWQFAQR